MAEVKNPLFSFAAQGKIGAFVYSTYKGVNIVYKLAPTKGRMPSLHQIAWREVFRVAATHWPDRSEAERVLFEWMSNNQRKLFWKSCKRSRYDPFRAYMKTRLRYGVYAMDAAVWVLIVAFLLAMYGFLPL